MDLEVELDRLPMKVVGSLHDVENALRKARRHVYGSLVPES